eukprot:2068675-Pleurochrysis_carterae.AAC.1
MGRLEVSLIVLSPVAVLSSATSAKIRIKRVSSLHLPLPLVPPRASSNLHIFYYLSVSPFHAPTCNKRACLKNRQARARVRSLLTDVSGLDLVIYV